mmetsp:Transcript_7761/g.12284  ORF Transcript_7761/g.12284 Transcript_7761/m.12284 type:complete len:178 (-) Transcript_7761:14-547(-)
MITRLLLLHWKKLLHLLMRGCLLLLLLLLLMRLHCASSGLVPYNRDSSCSHLLHVLLWRWQPLLASHHCRRGNPPLLTSHNCRRGHPSLLTSHHCRRGYPPLLVLQRRPPLLGGMGAGLGLGLILLLRYLDTLQTRLERLRALHQLAQLAGDRCQSPTAARKVCSTNKLMLALLHRI